MALTRLYAAMRTVENQLGGGEGVCGIYGSITQASMERVVSSLKTHTGFSADSILLDIGSGLGRPLAHVALDPGVRRGVGIELDAMKHAKALVFMDRVAQKMEMEFDVQLLNQDVKNHGSTYTHAYAFWEGFSPDDKRAVARLFNSSIEHIVIVQRAMRCPVLALADLGFCVHLLDVVPVTMSGSGRAFKAYVFKKISV